MAKNKTPQGRGVRGTLFGEFSWPPIRGTWGYPFALKANVSHCLSGMWRPAHFCASLFKTHSRRQLLANAAIAASRVAEPSPTWQGDLAWW